MYLQLILVSFSILCGLVSNALELRGEGGDLVLEVLHTSDGALDEGNNQAQHSQH